MSQLRSLHPRRALLTVLTLLLAFGTAQAASARGPSTQEERDKAVGLVHRLETDPLGKQAQEARAWLIAWLAEVPDITISVCAELMGPGFEMDPKYGAELTIQQAFSAAAFKIEHPDKATDDLAVDTAAVAGVLRTYRALLGQQPEAKFEALDDLLQAESEGRLSARVAELAKACH